jgi:hypothetical protein
MFRIASTIVVLFVGYLIGTGAIQIDADIAGPAIITAVDYVTAVVIDVYATITASTGI